MCRGYIRTDNELIESVIERRKLINEFREECEAMKVIFYKNKEMV